MTDQIRGAVRGIIIHKQDFPLKIAEYPFQRATNSTTLYFSLKVGTTIARSVIVNIVFPVSVGEKNHAVWLDLKRRRSSQHPNAAAMREKELIAAPTITDFGLYENCTRCSPDSNAAASSPFLGCA
jgi:hypothetical protein